MSRIMAIDWGSKRTGIAVTDPLRIIASPLETVPTDRVFDFLDRYLAAEQVAVIVVGAPFHEDGTPAQVAGQIDKFAARLRKRYPQVQVVRQDERYTSRMAADIILQSGARKKKRRDKSLVDKVSASLILQAYMDEHDLWGGSGAG